MTRRTGTRDYLGSRLTVAEVDAISRAIHFAEETGCSSHVVHVSTGRSIPLVSGARKRGADVSADTSPHYLLFAADDFAWICAAAKCAPPLRPPSDIDALWNSLLRGDVQIVASGHSPAPAHMNTGEDTFSVGGGISGYQSLLTSPLSEGHDTRGLRLTPLVVLLASALARRFRLPNKDQIAPGCDADLALVDIDRRVTLGTADLRHRHRHGHYGGMTFTGLPWRTIFHGETVAID